MKLVGSKNCIVSVISLWMTICFDSYVVWSLRWFRFAIIFGNNYDSICFSFCFCGNHHLFNSWKTVFDIFCSRIPLGLLRCGKSCRLRWTNYLRPDIKRGKFSDEEDQIILNLHALLGNRYNIYLYAYIYVDIISRA